MTGAAAPPTPAGTAPPTGASAAPGAALSPRAWARLVAGLLLYGVAVALMIASGRGLGPWDLLHQGIARVTGLSVGLASQAVGLVLLAGLWRAGVRFGAGTLLNIVGIGLVLDLVLAVLPEPTGVAAAWGYHASGIVLCGLATGLYISARLGAGPRDSLMLTLARRTGWNVRTVRTAIELVALGLGWALGGTLGLGTLAFALGIGPAVEVGMRLFGGNEAPAPVRVQSTGSGTPSSAP